MELTNMMGWRLWQITWRRRNGPVQTWHFYQPDHDTAWALAIEKLKRDIGPTAYVLNIEEAT